MCKLLQMRSLKSAALALTTVVLAGLSAPIAASSQQFELKEIEITGAIWCDKAEQVESLFRAHLAEGLGLEAAVAVTNAQAADPGACIAGMAIVSEAGETRRFVAGNQMLSITRYMVHGVMKDDQPVQIPTQVWYAAKVLAKLTAL